MKVDEESWSLMVPEDISDVDMGSYPFYRGQRFGTSIVMRCTDAARLDSAVAELKASIVELGGSPHEGDPPA